jgi:hypothetical protein
MVSLFDALPVLALALLIVCIPLISEQPPAL